MGIIIISGSTEPQRCGGMLEGTQSMVIYFLRSPSILCPSPVGSQLRSEKDFGIPSGRVIRSEVSDLITSPPRGLDQKFLI